MEKVFAYLRVSSPSQAKDDKDGFPRQEEQCRSYAKAHNLKIVKVFQEDITGMEYHRPVWAKLMVSLEQNGHGVKTVIIEKLDRLARSLMVQESLVADLQTNGFKLISAMEGADLLDDDPTRVMFRQMLGVWGQYNKAQIVLRLRAARERMKAKTGKCEGQKNYTETERGRELLHRIAELRKKPKYEKRKTYQQIADILNAEGRTTLQGKEWTLYRVQQIVKPFSKS